MKPQVNHLHYTTRNYDSKQRFVSYWHQIDEVLKTKPRKVLEIGFGNKNVSNYLIKQSIKLTTVDIDKRLKPDVICSVTELSKNFQANSYDTILCCEVLEHLPFEQFGKALQEIKKITKKYVILSLPYNATNFYFNLKLPVLKEMRINLRVPLFWLKHKFDGEHFWEIGKREYSLKRIKKVISKEFKIDRIFCPKENPYHLFFKLVKRK